MKKDERNLEMFEMFEMWQRDLWLYSYIQMELYRLDCPIMMKT